MKYTEQQIFEKYNDCVLKIVAYDSDEKYLSHGSAIVIKKDNMIVTNFHNIENAHNFKLYTEDGNLIEYSGIVAINPEKDILILNVNKDVIKKFPDLKLSTKVNYELAEKIISIGFQSDYGKIITSGIISGINKNVNLDSLKEGFIGKNMILITANLSPGSSGGAIINTDGEIIGISTLMDSRGQNLNFVIPSIDIQNIINEAKKEHKQEKNLFVLLEYIYRFGRAYSDGDYETAIINIDLCVDIDKNNLFYYWQKFRILTSKSDKNAMLKMIEDMESIVKIDLELFDYIKMLMLIELEDYNNALILANKYVANGTFDTDFYIMLGLINIGFKKFDDAIEILEKVKKNITDSELLYLSLSEAYENIGKIYKAVRVAFYGLQLFPESKLINIKLAYIYCNYSISTFYKIKYFEKSLNFVNKAIHFSEINNQVNIYPKEYTRLYLQKTSILIILNRSEDALKTINYLIEKNFELELGYLYRAQVYYLLEKYSEGLKDLNKVLLLNSLNSVAYLWIAYIKCKLKDYTSAKINIDKSCDLITDKIELLTEKVTLYYNIACVYYYLSDFKKTIYYLEKILTENSFNKNALILYATIYTKEGKISKAKDCYEICLKNNHEDSLIYNNYCDLLVNNKFYNEAIRVSSEAITKFGDNYSFYFFRGLAKYGKSRYKMAISDFNKAIELSPNSPEVYYYRGFAVHNCRLYQQAISDWEYTIILDVKYEKELAPLINYVAKDINPSFLRKVRRVFKIILKIIEKVINLLIYKN